jgi:hypothetical protein
VDFYNDRRPSVADDHEWDQLNQSPLDRDGLRAANTRVRSATPEYERADVNRKIRATAVRRHRARKAGQQDFASMGEYLNFICGSDDGTG